MEDALEVALSGYFSNQDGRESFMTQFLDHAKEVDLASLDLPVTRNYYSKLGVSPARTHFCRTRNVTGTPEMKATSFLFVATRTPRCHSLK